MRRVVGAGVLVVLLGGVHLVRWYGERSGPPPGEVLPPPAVTVAAASQPGAVSPAPPVVRAPRRADYFYAHPLRFLSTAPADSLALLPGIGPVLAARIVADRAARGPYSEWTELDRVRGIGPATIRRLETASRRP